MTRRTTTTSRTTSPATSTRARRRDRPLSERKRVFVNAYMGEAQGNATKAALIAGYSPKNARTQASALLTKPDIRAAIDRLAQSDPRIATREDLQRWWTAMFQNPDMEYRDRLRASELLGKSQGLFIDRHIHTGNVTLEQALTASRKPSDG